jgi:hypothetical protein
MMMGCERKVGNKEFWLDNKLLFLTVIVRIMRIFLFSLTFEFKNYAHLYIYSIEYKNKKVGWDCEWDWSYITSKIIVKQYTFRYIE